MPRDNGDFVLDVDASGTGMGAILQQKQDGILRVIAYASRTFNRQEANYCITRREMLVAVYGFKTVSAISAGPSIHTQIRSCGTNVPEIYS